jgi:hypothetical protein
VRSHPFWAVKVRKMAIRVYRLVITLACESGLPGWFAGDSVGNSDLATSSTTVRAVGQLP